MIKRHEIPLSKWARKMGLSQRTVQRHAQRGELPVPCRVDEHGRYMVLVDSSEFNTTLSPEELTDMLLSLRDQLTRIERKLDAR